MSDIAEFLGELGLAQFTEAFAENGVDFDLLPEITNEDLKDLGVVRLADRKRLLRAIAALGGARETSPEGTPEDTSATTGSVEAERRQLTVMFCDLVGSTELSGRLDPEDLREVMRRYQDTVAGAVVRFEGHVAKFLGDGVLAFFGWPHAYEDQAERAVRSGLAAVEAVANLKTEDDQALEARVGIATGQVVIGDLVGEAVTEEDAVAGETPILAARLQEVASSGQVVIGATTRLLIGDALDFEDIGAHQLKGFAEPVAIWRVLGESAVESRFEAAHARQLTRFVGRRHELGLLAERWTFAKGGEGQAAILAGEPGIGKSRLLEALRSRLSDEPYTYLHYQCSPFHTNSALYPVIRQLQRAAGFAPTDDLDQRLDKLEAILTGPPDVVAKQAPLFAALLSLSTDRYEPLDLSPQQFKDRIVDALNEQLLLLAKRQPVLFSFEDAHWIDPTSRSLLERTIGQITDAKVLMVMTHRPEFETSWTEYPHVMSLTLNRLSRTQGAEIAQAVGAEDLSADIVTRIVERTDGVPLFIEELTRAVMEAGGSAAGADTPASLQASLTERLDRLGDAKEIAQIGAVIGRDFSEALISAVVGTSDPDLGRKLERLVESGLVLRRGALTEMIYTFKHALVHDAAYESLLRERRQRLHNAVAEALLRELPELADSEPETLAHHYTEAGRAKTAVLYLQNAGRRATERSANIEAIAHLSNGLALLDSLPESLERDKVELDLRITLGPALMAVEGANSEKVTSSYSRARELCEHVGEIDHVFTVLFGIWLMNAAQGAISVGLEIADEMTRHTEASGNAGQRLQAHHCNWTSSLWSGNPGSCIDQAAHGLKIYDRDVHRTHKFLYAGHDPAVCGLASSGWAWWQIGYPDKGLGQAIEADELAADLDHPFSRVIALFFLTSVCHFRREHDETLQYADRGAAVCEEFGFGVWSQYLNVLRCFAQAQSGDRAAFLAMRQAIQRCEAVSGTLYMPWYLALKAIADRETGEISNGLANLRRAKAISERSGEHWFTAELHRIRGELLLSRSSSDSAKAEAAFGEALDVAQTRRAKSLELRAAVSMARLWRENNKRSDARKLLAPVYQSFTEGFETPDLKDAKALLDELA